MEKDNKEINKINQKARSAMYIVAVLNVVTAVMFYIAYNSSKEIGFLIAVIVNVICAFVILFLTRLLKNK